MRGSSCCTRARIALRDIGLHPSSMQRRSTRRTISSTDGRERDRYCSSMILLTRDSRAGSKRRAPRGAPSGKGIKEDVVAESRYRESHRSRVRRETPLALAMVTARSPHGPDPSINSATARSRTLACCQGISSLPRAASKCASMVAAWAIEDRARRSAMETSRSEFVPRSKMRTLPSSKSVSIQTKRESHSTISPVRTVKRSRG